MQNDEMMKEGEMSSDNMMQSNMDKQDDGMMKDMK